jgi:hypothetical protein
MPCIAQIVALWMVFVLLVSGGAYLIAGKKLANILAPKDANAAGATSAIAASNEIRNTSRTIAYLSFFFVISLIGYSQSVENGGQAAGVITWSFVNAFLLSGLGMQVRIVRYIRFGNRKKLIKAGFSNGMNSSWMRSSASSTVAPEGGGIMGAARRLSMRASTARDRGSTASVSDEKS